MQSTARTSGALLQASHPLPALAVTLVTAGLAVTADRSLAGTATIAAAVFAGQLSVGWLNDLLDAARDAQAGRTDKPLATGRLSPTTVRIAFWASAIAAVLLTLLSGLPPAAAHLAALLSAWAYNLRLKSTVFSAVPFAVSFGLLPAIVSLGDGGPWPPWWLTAAAACLGCGAHFVNTLPDFADDEATGVRGLPHRLGPNATPFAAATLVLAASVLLAFGPPGPAAPLGLIAVPVSAAVLMAGLALGRRLRSRAAFRAVMLVALVDVALLLHTGVAAG